ncbi:MAG TPA: hypothetical protein VMU43_02150 [Candidatus Acidoferrum sp.]|nr:hypothetical protein [Candidatus Acidoferrum sp.]
MSVSQVSMDCEFFERILCDLDREGVLPAAVRDAALVHAEGCARCGRLLTESESLDMHLRSLGISAKMQSPSPHVESVLLDEFRGFHGERRLIRRRWQLAALGVAAAAVLAVSYFLFGHFAPGRNTVKDAEQTRGHSAAPAFEQQATDATAPDSLRAASSTEGSEAPSNKSLVKSAVPAENATSQPEKNLAQEAAFIPLPYADATAEIEGGQVVRVILSPVALESMGLRSSEFGSSGNVSADLLLDEAGTPEAIRLAAQSDSVSTPN